MADGADAYFEEHRDSTGLAGQALRGGVTSVTVQYGNAVLQIVAAVVLARLLTPEDFGLVAIVAVMTSFAPSLIEFGLTDAAIQKLKITRNQVSSLFWISSGIGALIAAIVAVSGPLIAWIYREPRLEAIAMYSALAFLLTGLSTQHLALLRRKMEFAAVSKVIILGSLTGFAVAVFLAVRGYGYWALVARPIVSAFFVAASSWYYCRWRPGRPVFDEEVTSMVRFGLHVVGFLVLNSFARAFDRIALSLFHRPEEVGYYQNAINLYDNYFTALSPLHNVASASLSKLQSNPAALRQKYEAAISVLSFFVMPAAAILSVTGEDVTTLLLGEKWREAGLLLGILALRGISQVVEWSQGWLHLAIGRPDRWRNWGVVTVAIQVVAVLAGMSFGPVGIAVACVIASFLSVLPSASYAGRPIGIDVAFVVRATGPQWIGSVVTAAAGWLATATLLAGYPGIVRIILSVGICLVVYLIIVVGLFRIVHPLRVAMKVVEDQLSKFRRQ